MARNYEESATAPVSIMKAKTSNEADWILALNQHYTVDSAQLGDVV